MFRPIRLATAVALVLVAVSCGESPTATSSSGVRPLRARATIAIDPGTCTTLSALLDQAATVFGEGSPDLNSVVGKLNNLQHQIEVGELETTKAHAHDIVEFVLRKWKEGGLAGTGAQVAAFLSNVYCFAGLDITVSDPSNTALIFPSDSDQVVYSADAQSGIHFPSNPVNAPTLITFSAVPDTFSTPGAGPLTTKLDQYPGFIAITAQADADTILAKPAVVGVCAQGAIPQEVRDRLRLGHDASAGFEITPAADAAFLQCENAVADATVRPSFLRSVARALMPALLHARMQDMAFGGGVGGSVTEFSPFAPVDPTLSASGGVGGSVTEFIKVSPSGSLFTSALMSLSAQSCDPIEAPVGSPVADQCLPFVRIHTRLGTDFAQVPVTWAVTEGGGTIALRSPSACGSYDASIVGTTSTSGQSGICWTLGAAGLNRVTATPGVGGDAPFGVFFNPAVVTFDATANPPVSLVFTQSPTSSVVAGEPFKVKVLEVDKYGNRVLGAADPVTVTLNQYSFAGGAASATVTAVAGEAVFPSLVIEKAASNYVLSASASFLLPPQILPTSPPFGVVAASAAAIAIVQGDGQVAPSGSAVPIPPTVRVSDAFGNAVSGAGVHWTAGLSSTGSVSPENSTSDAAGEASTTWTLGDGGNQLRAELIANAAAFVVFEATGTSTLSVLNYCPTGGSSDPVNDPSKPYAFYIPDPGPNKTIRQIQLQFSSTGKANAPTSYVIELATQRGTFDDALSPPVRTTTTVMLRGNNSEHKTATFTLSQPLIGMPKGGEPVMVRLRVLSNPDNTTITFNTGPCPPGKSCKVPVGCEATEVSSPLPYPLGTFYRKSVGVTVKGG